MIWLDADRKKTIALIIEILTFVTIVCAMLIELLQGLSVQTEAVVSGSTVVFSGSLLAKSRCVD